MDDKTIYELYASSIPSLVRLNTVALLNNDVWCCLSRLSEIEKTHNELIDAKIVDALVVALKTCETREMLDNVICTCGNLLTTKQGFDALVKNDDCVSCIVTYIIIIFFFFLRKKLTKTDKNSKKNKKEYRFKR